MEGLFVYIILRWVCVSFIQCQVFFLKYSCLKFFSAILILSPTFTTCNFTCKPLSGPFVQLLQFN